MNIILRADEIRVSVTDGVCDGCGCGVGRYWHSVEQCLKWFRETVRELIEDPRRDEK